MNNKKEQLYLRFSPVTPRKLQLNIYHRYYECDHRGLSKIEMLGNDFDSTLEKYFRARNCHKEWRFAKQLVKHVAAIRSARLWFDSSVRLVELHSSPLPDGRGNK